MVPKVQNKKFKTPFGSLIIFFLLNILIRNLKGWKSEKKKNENSREEENEPRRTGKHRKGLGRKRKKKIKKKKSKKDKNKRKLRGVNHQQNLYSV